MGPIIDDYNAKIDYLKKNNYEIHSFLFKDIMGVDFHAYNLLSEEERRKYQGLDSKTKNK